MSQLDDDFASMVAGGGIDAFEFGGDSRCKYCGARGLWARRWGRWVLMEDEGTVHRCLDKAPLKGWPNDTAG